MSPLHRRRWATPGPCRSLDRIDIARARLFQEDAWPRLVSRGCGATIPVHFHAESEFGPFWSITRYLPDIMKVETTPEVFSSELGITLFDTEEQH